MSDKICSVIGCCENVKTRGWCKRHYTHWRRHGSPDNYVSERHGMTGSPEYKSWQKMKERCLNPKSNRFEYYGGKGVTICKEWKNSFMAFYKDMGHKPNLWSQIDRRKTSGNYEPGNCRWTTAAENSQNRTSTRANPDIVKEIRIRVENGETQISICKEFNLSPNCVNGIVNRNTWKNIK